MIIVLLVNPVHCQIEIFYSIHCKWEVVAVIVKILSYKALEISPLLIQILKERLILLGDLIYEFWSCIAHHIQIN